MPAESEYDGRARMALKIIFLASIVWLIGSTSSSGQPIRPFTAGDCHLVGDHAADVMRSRLRGAPKSAVAETLDAFLEERATEGASSDLLLWTREALTENVQTAYRRPKHISARVHQEVITRFGNDAAMRCFASLYD